MIKDENGIKNENDQFLQAFLFSHPWFIDSQDLCDNLLEMYVSRCSLLITDIYVDQGIDLFLTYKF